MKKTVQKQEAIEKLYGKPFRQVLVELCNLKGCKGAAAELGVSPSTFGYWMLRERVIIIRRAE